MRLPILTLFLIAASLFGETQATSAQSAYSYPWCAVYQMKDSGGTKSCYYTSYQQCMLTYSDHSAYCVRSPYYLGPVAATPAARLRHRRHSG
jgi:uncharacterized protein DUF3551